MRKKKESTDPDPSQPEPSSAPRASERRAIEAARSSVKSRRPRVSLEFKQDSDGGNVELLGGGHSDHAGWLLRLQDAFGTHGTAFAISQLNHLMAAAREPKGKIDRVRVNSMLAMIEGLKPANELQAALAVQAAITHNVALTITQRAMRVDQIPQFDSAANIAVKLLRTFVLQTEALGKLQRGGEQVVKVVHVHPGAQAVVGNVTTQKGSHDHATDREGGANHESSNQPHAKGLPPAADTADLLPVWRSDTERESVPITGSTR